MAHNINTYDEWIGELDDGFTEAIKLLGLRIDKLQSEWAGTQQQIQKIKTRSEVLPDQPHGVCPSDLVVSPKSIISMVP